MKKRLAAVGRAVWKALASKQARGPELVLLRLILAALGVKLGINFAQYAK